MMKQVLFTSSFRKWLAFASFFLFASYAGEAQCSADAAAIEITGSGETMTSICVDGTADPVDVTIVGTPVGTNNGWIITDSATGDILALPPASQTTFDLDGAGVGVCDIYYVRYEAGTTGIALGSNISGITGCFDLSNAITVYRTDPADAGAIEITGTGETMTSICVDGTGDPIDVTIIGPTVGDNNGWIITDQTTGNILALPPASQTTFDLDGAGVGVCNIYYVRYATGTTGIGLGNNIADITGCFDLSNAITVYRTDPADAAAIEITGTGATTAEICSGDGNADPIDVSIVGAGVGDNNGWIITDQATGNILALPPGPPFDLEGVFEGVCDIYYVRYATGTTGIALGNNLNDIAGCFDLSNPISVTRNEVNGAAIEITGTGATSIDICAGDGVGDPIDVTIVGTGVGDVGGWVITDNATGEILGLPPAPPFDLEGAGAGVCDIWYIRYETGLTGLVLGNNVADLSGCFDFSNPITVNRTGVDAAAIEITGTGATSTIICAGDGIGDPIDVSIVGTGVGTNNGWVITDQATGTILALPPGPPFDLDGAGSGICDIWYIRYEPGLTGLSVGEDVTNLNGCFDLSNPISVNREVTFAPPIFVTGSAGNTTVSICAGDGIPNPIGVTIDGTGVGDVGGWIITDNATGDILALPPAPPFDLEGAGAGVCDIWYIRYANGLSGLATGNNLADLDGCFDLSNPVSVNRLGVDGAAIEIAGTGATTVDICAGDGVGDPIDVDITGAGVGPFNGWVITDQATGTILALPPGPPFDLEGAGDGVCDIWYIRYQTGLMGLEVGENVADLVGCFDFSNPISVNRNGVDGAAIQITGTTSTEVTICASDGIADPIDVEVVGNSVGTNGGWVITDQATGDILALPPAPPFDLDGAGPGVCDIWYIRYEPGLTGLAVGNNLTDLDGCYDFSNPVIVTRVTGNDCEVLNTDDFNLENDLTIFPNPAVNSVNIGYSGTQATRLQVVIYDLQGREVGLREFEAQTETQLDIASLSSGTYLVRISDANSGASVTKKLVKR